MLEIPPTHTIVIIATAFSWLIGLREQRDKYPACKRRRLGNPSVKLSTASFDRRARIVSADVRGKCRTDKFAFDYAPDNRVRKIEMNENTLQERAKKLVKPLIPPDAEDRVRRAYKQWNQSIRDHIRSETALKLADGDGRQSLQVKIVDGFPAGLAQLIGEHRDPVIWRLIVGQPKLGGVVEGLSFLLQDWDEFEQWNSLPNVAKGKKASIQETLEIVNALQKEAIAETVREQIKKIDEDILGAYHFSGDRQSYIELYWMAIAMVAAMIDVRIEDLTAVVLAHELAHGYTHIGRDIDGTQWSDHAFSTCDLKIVEGLAQFYTKVVTEKLAQRAPGPNIAYERLLKLQSGPYLVHKEWLTDEPRDRGEAVRFTMVAVRGQGQTNYEDWQETLKKAVNSLRKKPNKQQSD